MDSFEPRSKKGPEKVISEAIQMYLRHRGWYVIVTHGNMYQSGFPDLYCTHSRYGIRWVEVKKPEMKGSKFTPAQLDVFPKLSAHGTRIWILSAATDEEYKKLFGPANWHLFLDIWRSNG